MTKRRKPSKRAKTYDLSLKGLFKDPPVNLLKLILGVEIDPKRVKFLDTWFIESFTPTSLCGYL